MASVALSNSRRSLSTDKCAGSKTTEILLLILLCVYLLHCKLEPNQCNIEENNKHRIGGLKVDERSIRMEIVVYKS